MFPEIPPAAQSSTPAPAPHGVRRLEGTGGPVATGGAGSVGGVGGIAGAGILDAWLGTTDDGVLALDAEGTVVVHNPAASRVTGLAPAAALGRSWREVLRLEPWVAARLWEARHAGTTHVTTDILCAQGNLRSTEVTAVPWREGPSGGLLILIRDLAILCRQNAGPAGRAGYGNLVGEHPAMQALYRLIEAVAPSDAPVLVQGERGTGKELIAQLIHARSRRAERPLIAVDCGALPPDLAEAELFGVVRARGSGRATSLGRLELAHTGTVFLDEVGALPAAAQARLLAALERGAVERLGEGVPRRVDLRVVSASTAPLEAEVAAGRVRADLYHRLAVVRVTVPPLRERLSDLPLLAAHFLEKHGPPGAELAPGALEVLQGYGWPGNVRELEQVIRRALARLEGPPGDHPVRIEADLLRAELPGGAGSAPAAAPAREPEDRRAVLLRALSSHGGNRAAAARSLGIGRATFYRWWKEAGLAGDAAPGP